jgi:hypothetical protein
MAAVGQLIQEPSTSTTGFGPEPSWLPSWACSFFTGTRTGSDSPTRALYLFDRSLSNVQIVPIYRFHYQSTADKFADLLNHTIPSRTALPQSEAEYSIEVKHVSHDPEVTVGEEIDDIIKWLDITYDELSKITGIGRSTLFYWRQTGNPPRGSNSRQVHRVHALASLLEKRFGPIGAQRWLQSGLERPWDTLIRGDVDTVEELARTALFRQAANYAGSPAVGREADWPRTAVRSPAPLARARRVPKKGRPKGS